MPPKLPFADYTGQFFWDFKRMDNANYNFEILENLYTAKTRTNDRHFNKPIILIITSIIECMMYDFAIRLKQHRSDLVPNITYAVISFFRGNKETDELKKLIKYFKDNDLFLAAPADTIYDDLEDLRLVRNRIHIQNVWNNLERDEYNVFTDTRRRLAEKVFERVCEILCNTYPRGNQGPLPMAQFPRPW